MEFVNGGHGIKNPLASHEVLPGPPRPATRPTPEEPAPVDEVSEQSQTLNFTLSKKSIVINKQIKKHNKRLLPGLGLLANLL